MYHFPYRQYSPATARWLTRDPLGMVDGPNMCAHVMGNPVGNWDPLGLYVDPYCKQACYAAFAVMVAVIMGDALLCFSKCAGMVIPWLQAACVAYCSLKMSAALIAATFWLSSCLENCDKDACVVGGGGGGGRPPCPSGMQCSRS